MSKKERLHQHLKDYAWLIKKDISGIPPATGPNWPERIDVKAGDIAEMIFPAQPDPQPDPFPEPVREIQMHGLSLWEWFKRIAWDGNREDEALYELRRTIRKARKYRVSLIDSFFFVSEKRPKHRDASKRTPWVFQNGEYDLDRFQDRFWELFGKFLTVFYDEKTHFMPQLAMGFGYNRWAFTNNKQGIRVSHVWDFPTVPYFRRLVFKAGLSYQHVYGKDYNPFIKPCNEFDHGEDCRKFHDILYWNQYLWDGCLEKITERFRIISDISHCEAVRAPFTEEGDCPKPECCPEPDNRHGVPGQKKPLRPPYEVHGCSTDKDLDFHDISRVSHNHIGRYTEDGGSVTKTGKGETWETRNWADARQTYEAGKHLFGTAREMGNTYMFALFPVETLNKTTELADYRVEKIHWDRFDALRQAYEEVYE